MLARTELSPTEEQRHVVSLAKAKDNLQIRAFAGTGKTATLRMLAEEIEGPKLYVAFNKRIIEEALEGFPAEAKTLNSVGWQASRNTISGKCTLDTKKSPTLFKQAIASLKGEDKSTAWDLYGDILDTVALAKAAGYVPPGYRGRARGLVGEEFWGQVALLPIGRELVDQMLEHSLKLCYGGCFDFDDQLYFPIVCGGSFPRFPCVFVDEEQDLNAVNHAMVRKLTRSGRLISVGDPFQSIYGFRGAVQGGMDLNQARFKMESAQLSVSFRCKSEIVRNARWRVPHFRWNREGGRVQHLQELSWGGIQDGSAIICRNNAPLFRLALNLLSNGRACRVAGSDVGPKLLGALKRLDVGGSSVLAAIDTWLEKHPGKEDFAECMRVFANASQSLGEAIARAEYVLRQDGPITLITGHKAKGLEWDTVYHLDPWLIKDNHEQELNLRYVIQTRAKEEYYEVDSRSIA